MVNSIYSTSVDDVSEWCCSSRNGGSKTWVNRFFFYESQLRLFATFKQENVIGLLSSNIKLS